MRPAITIAVVMLLIVAVSAVMAEPYVSVWEDETTDFQGTSSWFGNVGLIVTPTAVLPPASAATLQYHRIQRDIEDVNVWGVNFGVTRWLEAGGSHIDLDGGGNETVGNVKVKLDAARWLDNPSIPDMAVGAFDVTDQLNRSLYFVMSKSYPVDGAFTPRINLHLGFANSETGFGALDGLFGGIEFQAMKYGLVQAEYDGNAFNADFRFNASQHLSLDLGVLDGDFGYGATYRSQF